MSNQERIDKIKQGLSSDIYTKLDKLDQMSIDEGTPTDKLANILDGYMTKVDNIKLNEELTMLHEQEIELEVDDEQLLKAYNASIHKSDTISDLAEAVNVSASDIEEVEVDLDTQIQDLLNEPSDPVVQATPEQTVEPEPVVQATPEQTVEPEPVVQATPEPIVEPEPVVQATPEQTVEPGPVVQATPEPIVDESLLAEKKRLEEEYQKLLREKEKIKKPPEKLSVKSIDLNSIPVEKETKIQEEEIDKEFIDSDSGSKAGKFFDIFITIALIIVFIALVLFAYQSGIIPGFGAK